MQIAIIGSHGLYASYGGWDQLVNNLVEKASLNNSYLVFNPKETPFDPSKTPANVKVIKLPLSAAGYQGLIFDFISIFIAIFYCRNQLLLGIQGIPASVVLKILSFNRLKVAVNIGGVEWERPQFSRFARWYLKLCFALSKRFADKVVIDNEHYLQYFDKEFRNSKQLQVIAYGGFIDKTIQSSDDSLDEKYPFIDSEYFLSVSRSIEDNNLFEICDFFKKRPAATLTLISNFSNSDYGLSILREFSSVTNIYLIDGLYIKPELDFLRRNCKAYIHTHTLCGSAPSLIEMIVTGKPILSIDVPQNRFTLGGHGFLFSKFSDLDKLISLKDLSHFQPDQNYSKSFEWESVVRKYEACFNDA
jgi:hypothetical protein